MGAAGGPLASQYLPTPRSASAMDTLLNSSHHLAYKEDGGASDINSALADNLTGRYCSVSLHPSLPSYSCLLVSDKAVSALVDWTSSVLTTLQSIKWKPIGFEQRPSDGFIDHSKPLHSITNPNLAIDQLLSEYALSDIGGTLTTLLMKVNEINGKEGGAGGAAGSNRKKQKVGPPNVSGKSNGYHGSSSSVSPRVVEEAAVGCYPSNETGSERGAGGGSVSSSRTTKTPVQQRGAGGEASVYFILACNQRTASSTAAEDCGFPAFDSDMQLVS